MDQTSRTIVLAALAVLAVTFAAATLDSTVSTEPSGPDGPGSGEGSGTGGLAPPQYGDSPGNALQIPFLSEILVLLAALAALAVLAYLYVYWRSVLRVVAGTAVLLGLFALLAQFLSFQASPPAPALPAPIDGNPVGGGGGGESTQPSPFPLLATFVLGVVLVGSLAAVFRDRSDSSEATTSAPETTDDADAAAVGQAAGRAADNLEETEDVENEVYRAWREMTGLLDVDDPETSTPTEFADAAIDAGMGRTDVRELTRLFQTVRYGNVEPDEDHEQRAIDVLRRIEARYTEDGS
ncbi:DUF4129 domain-containing protein [Halomicrobium urmianum]|uniref:DUF4129 domain-containing protein n=1 Tax=Halomicrobium urmianum TaxID=1586233 RepID=UPI001CDA30E5|nr:DUF4129 domain-containing protein [Halomicrobium urmianum]